VSVSSNVATYVLSVLLARKGGIESDHKLSSDDFLELENNGEVQTLSAVQTMTGVEVASPVDKSQGR
jgi:hypothetical protein